MTSNGKSNHKSNPAVSPVFVIKACLATRASAGSCVTVAKQPFSRSLSLYTHITGIRMRLLRPNPEERASQQSQKAPCSIAGSRVVRAGRRRTQSQVILDTRAVPRCLIITGTSTHFTWSRGLQEGVISSVDKDNRRRGDSVFSGFGKERSAGLVKRTVRRVLFYGPRCVG